MVAFVDHDVTVGADQIVKIIACRSMVRAGDAVERRVIRIDHVADRPALHRDDRLMTITPVRGCCEARDVSR